MLNSPSTPTSSTSTRTPATVDGSNRPIEDTRPLRSVDAIRSDLEHPHTAALTALHSTTIGDGPIGRLLRDVQPLLAEVERLSSCDCAASEDGNPHHQGYCRSLPTEAKRERNARTAATISQLVEHGRDSNDLARQVADAHDATAAVRAEVEDWQEKWRIVDADRCEAQDERDAARGLVAAVEEVVAASRRVSPSGSMVVYVADLERALGRAAARPHKMGVSEPPPKETRP